MNFNSHTDSVADVAAALVNLVTPGARQGRDYEPPVGRELLSGIGDAVRRGNRRSSRPDPAAADAFVELGKRLRPIFEQVDAGESDGAAATANALLERYRPTPYLDRHDGEPWHLHYHGASRHDRSGWGGGCSVAVATVLGGEYADRLGVCGAPRCDRVFVDVSRNGTRRFCSSACQNRVKAAAHRARSA